MYFSKVCHNFQDSKLNRISVFSHLTSLLGHRGRTLCYGKFENTNMKMSVANNTRTKSYKNWPGNNTDSLL